MKIKSLIFSDPTESGLATKVVFNSSMNLVVGASGSGKTRVLNILFNLARMGCGVTTLGPGSWELEFQHNKIDFLWRAEVRKKAVSLKLGDPAVSVIFEELYYLDENGSEVEIFSSSDDKSSFFGKVSPRIIRAHSAIGMYREEEFVKDAFFALSLISRRNFAGDDLASSVALQTFPYAIMNKLGKTKHRKISDVFNYQMSLHSKMFVLEKYFPSVLRNISEQYRLVFPRFEKFSLQSSQQISQNVGFDAPVVLMHEKGVAKGTPINEISSGMQKVLLIIVDVFCLPAETLYIIDEYENSLGANAIDFLPIFLAEFGTGTQFIITTHHPVLINEISPEDWLVFRRKGSTIHVTYGHELAKKYGKSRQQLFVQLLNDPAYEG